MTPDWNRIRDYYRSEESEIFAAGRNGWADDPYAWEHRAGIKLTPIENALWSDIRRVGVVMYPQYPVGRRFVDFGNPVAKVAIECDGAAFHSDPGKDRARQDEIEARGWTVYRISGSDCMKDHAEVCEDGRIRLVLSEAYRLVREIADRHDIRYCGGSGRVLPASAFTERVVKNFERRRAA